MGLSLGSRTCTRMMLFVFFILGIQRAVGNTYIEIHFLRYTHNCEEDINDNPCDPMFTFCLARPTSSVSISSCYYGRVGESGYFQDTKNIYLEPLTNIKGIPNPWRISTERLLDKQIMLVTRTRDDDTFGGDDHMATWSTTLTEPVYRSASVAQWASRSMTSGSNVLTFKIRIYCEAYYYTDTCDVYCIAQDSPTGHYMCDQDTGDRLCLSGWTGANCTEDVDECALNFCERGSCENLDGDYICYCPVHYTGKNCSSITDPCDTNPCSNNGTCVFSQDPYSYTCECVGGWKGEHCDEGVKPCDAAPCQNGAECINMENSTTYTCNCSYPYTGKNCDKVIPGATTTTTAKPSPQGQVSTKEGSFLLWHGILIALLILLVIIIIIACLVIRRRRRKQKEYHDGLPPPQTTVVYSVGDNLSFENGMYNDITRGAKTQQNGRVAPTTPTDDALFNPEKPVFCPDDLGTQGAVGDSGGYMDMDGDGYVRASDHTDSVEKRSASHPPGTERANSNQYADFSTLKGDGKAGDENHYQDLDEMAIAVRDLDNAIALTEAYSDPDSKKPRGAGSYSDVPNNFPAYPGSSFKRFNSEKFPPTDDDDDDDIQMPEWTAPKPPMTAEAENPYTEPVAPAPTEPQETFSTFKQGPLDPYAHAPVIQPQTSNPFAEDVPVDEEDVVPDFGLPPTFNGGYDTPRGSQKGQSLLSSQGSHYETPPGSLRSARTSGNSEYDSPHSFGTSQRAVPPPPVPSKPPNYSKGSRRIHDENGYANFGDEDVSQSTDDFPRSLSVREGITLSAEDNTVQFETNVDHDLSNGDTENSEWRPGLYMENNTFGKEGQPAEFDVDDKQPIVDNDRPNSKQPELYMENYNFTHEGDGGGTE